MPALVGTLLVLGVSVYALGTLSASVPRWIVIYVWAIIPLLAFVVAVRRGRIRLDEIDSAALLVMLWCGMSLAWAVDWRAAVYSFVNLGALYLVFMWVRHARLAHVAYLPEAALMAILVGLTMQGIWPYDYGGHGNRNFQTEALILCLALGCATRTLIGFVGCFIVGGAAVIYLVLFNGSHVEWWVIGCLSIIWSLRAGFSLLRSRAGRSSSRRMSFERG